MSNSGPVRQNANGQGFGVVKLTSRSISPIPTQRSELAERASASPSEARSERDKLASVGQPASN